MAVGGSARIPLVGTHAIAVSNWSARDLDEDLDLRAREKHHRVLDRLRIVEAFEQLDREPQELSLQAQVIGTAPSLQADAARTRVRSACQELALRALAMREHLTGLVQTDQVDGRLRKVGADRDDRLQYARGGYLLG